MFIVRYDCCIFIIYFVDLRCLFCVCFEVVLVGLISIVLILRVWFMVVCIFSWLGVCYAFFCFTFCLLSFVLLFCCELCLFDFLVVGFVKWVVLGVCCFSTKLVRLLDFVKGLALCVLRLLSNVTLIFDLIVICGLFYVKVF